MKIIKNLKFIFIFAVLSLGSITYTNAAQLGLVVKYADSGGGAGDLNQIGDQVNGVNICPTANSNSNIAPGCDMTKNVGYHNNHTPNNPTDDYYTGDRIVRTNDIFSFNVGRNWIKEGDGADSVNINCQLPSSGGVTRPGYKRAFLPGSCAVGSSISADGKTINCIRGSFDPNSVGTYAEDIQFPVRVLGGNENGYQPGDINCTISSLNADSKNDSTDNTSLIITASPRWNIQNGIYHMAAGQTWSGQEGYIIYYKNYIEVDEVAGTTDSIGGFLGNESLGKDATLTWNVDLSEISANAEFIDCDPDIGWINTGDPYNYYYSPYPDRSTATPNGVQSMTCVSSGPGGNMSITLQHLDASLDHYPTNDHLGSALPVNRKIAAMNLMRVFVPIDDVKAGEDGILGTSDDGQLLTRNTITNFDPNGISGLSNFGPGTESTLDNYINYTLYASAGSRDKYYRGDYPYNINTRFNRPYDVMTYRSGKGIVTPGAKFYTMITHHNYGGTNITGIKLCDVIDANTYDIVADWGTYNDSTTAHTPGTPMYLHNNYGINTVPYHYEYATTYETARPPNPYTNNSAIVNIECDDVGTTWYTDFNTARANGPITKVRLVIDGPETPGMVFYRWVAHEARSTNLSGVLLTGGTLLPNYSTFTDSAAGRNGQWYVGTTYAPNTYTGAHAGFGGDRLILQRAKARIVKGAIPLDQNGTPTGSPASSPGLQIKYILTGSFTTDGSVNESANVVIKDLLPAGIEYIAGSTESPYGEPVISNDCSLVQDLVSQGYICNANSQILIWDLGTRTSNSPIPAIVFKTLVSINAIQGNTSNYALIESPVDSSAPVQRTANANVIVSVPSSLLIVKNIEQGRNQFNTGGMLNWIKFGLNVRNGTTSSLSDLDVIDVFPFKGDNSSGMQFTVGASTITSRRNPATSYHGQFEFYRTSITNVTNCNIGSVSWYYSNTPSHQINLSPTDSSNQLGGSTNRCLGDQNGPSASCGFTKSQSTAIRVNGPSMSSQGICRISVEFGTNNNLGGDMYTNNAGAYAQGVSLAVLSNSVTAYVYDYKIGDTVWYDHNQDGILNSGENIVSGAIVSLYDNAGNFITATTTSSTGYYIFTGLASNTYKVVLSPITGTMYGYDQDSINGSSDGETTVVLTGDTLTSRMDIDFGIYKLSSLGGNIYLDNNIDRVYDAGDLGLSGMTVILSGTNLLGDNVYITGLVSSTGSYIFTGLAGGVYSVSYINNTSYVPEVSNPGMVGTGVSGLSSGTNTINIITLNYGDDSINNNFGLAVPASINGTVWYDMNADMNIGGETFVSGARVVVTYTNDVEGTVTHTIYTDANGNWSVGNILSGSSYTVAIDMSYGPANGYRITTNNVTYSGTVGYAETKHVGDQGLYLTNVMINKTVDVSTATLGDVITYTINYANNSSGTAYNVSVYDLFPFQYLSINSSTPNFSSPATTAGLSTPTTLTYNIGTLQPGQGGSITIAATIITGVDAQIINNLGAIDTAGTGNVTGSTVTVTTGSINTNITGSTETNSGDNVSIALVTIYRIDLGLVKDVDRTTVGPNDVFEYTLNLSNNTGTVRDIVVMDTLDSNLVYVGMSSGTITSNPIISGQNLTRTGITFDPFSTNTIKILVKPARYLNNGTVLNNNAMIGRINNLGALVPLYETVSTNNISSASVTLSGTNFANIAGRVYFDQNVSELIDGVDTYISGVVVNLYSGSTIISTTTTDAGGNYLFNYLVSGDYTVQYQTPSGYESFTSKGGINASNNGLGSIDSGSISNTGIFLISISDGNNTTNNDFGLIKTSSIGGIIYQDLSKNLAQDSIDILLSGQTVLLTGIDVFGNPVSITTTTNNSGLYNFTDLIPGNYNISYTNNIDNLNPFASFTGSVGSTTNQTQSINGINLLSEVSATNYDFSLVGIPSSIAGNIYLDNNLTNILDGDTLLPGLSVTLSGTNILGENISITTTTDVNGSYIFTGLEDGVYNVTYTNTTQYIPSVSNTGTINGANVGNIASLTGLNNIVLKYGQSSIDNNFGLVELSSIGGSVYQDDNKDKTNNDGNFLPNQTIYLRGTDILGNIVILTTTTDSNGRYIFEDVMPGNYSISYHNTYDELSPFASNPGSVGGSSNGYQIITGITLNPNNNATNYDFGLIPSIYRQTIAGNIYIDDNSTYNLESSDPMYISGASIVLSGVDISGNVVNLITVAGADGSYKFVNLEEGIYDIYLDHTSIPGYVHHASNTGTILGQETGNVNNLIIQSINLLSEQDGINYNFGLTHMDLNTTIVCEPEEARAGATITCVVTYLNNGITNSNNTVIDLSSTNGLVINSNDVRKNLGTLSPGESGSYTITATIAMNPDLVMQTLDIRAHIYSQTTPELDVLSNFSQDSVYVLVEPLYSIGGDIYHDLNEDDYKSQYDVVYTSGAVVTISGKDRFDRSVNISVVIGEDGKYIFTGLIEGNYNVSISNIDPKYNYFTSNAGMIDSSIAGIGHTEGGENIMIKNILLNGNGVKYDFGVVLRPVIFPSQGQNYTQEPIYTEPPKIIVEDAIIDKKETEKTEQVKTTEEIIKSIDSNLHKTADISINDIHSDEIIITKGLSLPKTGVDL